MWTIGRKVPFVVLWKEYGDKEEHCGRSMCTQCHGRQAHLDQGLNLPVASWTGERAMAVLFMLRIVESRALAVNERVTVTCRKCNCTDCCQTYPRGRKQYNNSWTTSRSQFEDDQNS